VAAFDANVDAKEHLQLIHTGKNSRPNTNRQAGLIFTIKVTPKRNKKKYRKNFQVEVGLLPDWWSKKTPPTEVFFHPEKSAFKATSRAVGSVVCPEVNNSVNMGMLPASAEAGHLKGSNGQSTFWPFKATYMGVSENGGIPKSSISIGFPL